MVLLGERVGPAVALRPPRDALDEAGFRRGDLLQPLLKLPYNRALTFAKDKSMKKENVLGYKKLGIATGLMNR